MNGTESEVCIVEYDCMSGLGLDIAETWRRLADGDSAISNITRIDDPDKEIEPVRYAAQLPATFEALAGGARELRKWPEPAFHCIKELSGRILQRLSFDQADVVRERIGLIGASALSSQLSFRAVQERIARKKRSANFIFSQCQNVPLSQVSAEFGIEGPSFVVESACASSAHAVLIASHLIGAGLVDGVMVAGFEFPLIAENLSGFGWLKALYRPESANDRGLAAPRCAMRPFSIDRRGFVPGEAVAVAFLCSRSLAVKNEWGVRGRIMGGWMNTNGEHLARAKRDAIAGCMRHALERARCETSDIDCINAHATSTPYGDQTELEALRDVFGDRLAVVPVIANKSQLGHTLGASGLMETLVAVEGICNDLALPTLNFVADPAIPVASISAAAKPLKHRVVLKNSFGFGGTNVSFVIAAED